jgi:hypothetical protein
MALREYDRVAYDKANSAAVNGLLGSQIINPETLIAAGSSDSTDSPTTAVVARPMFMFSTDSLITSAGTLNVAPFRAAGTEVKVEANKNFQLEVDYIIMRLICVRGLVPNILDSSEWKDLTHKLNSIYKPTSSTTFREDYIPKEAAFVRNRQINLLKKEENLTLTFNGTTIRIQDSFYTAHATTPTWNTYLLDGHQGTDEHYDAAWIMDKLLKVRWRTLTLGKHTSSLHF